MKHILKYLKRTIDYILVYHGDELALYDIMIMSFN